MTATKEHIEKCKQKIRERDGFRKQNLGNVVEDLSFWMKFAVDGEDDHGIEKFNECYIQYRKDFFDSIPGHLSPGERKVVLARFEEHCQEIITIVSWGL